MNLLLVKNTNSRAVHWIHWKPAGLTIVEAINQPSLDLGITNSYGFKPVALSIPALADF